MNMAPERHKIYLECANAVKQEPVEADTLGSAKREIEYVCVKEETTEWEVPDGHDEVPDPLSIDKKELSFSEDFLEPSTFNIEKTEEEEEEEKVRGDDLEVLIHEVESTTSGSEQGSVITIGLEDNKTDHDSSGLVTNVSLAPETDNSLQSTSKQEASCWIKTGTSYLGHRCDTSKKVFANLQDLKAHSHVDSHGLQHSCSLCHKTFTTSRSLKRHLRLHTGERPYSCSICHKTFTECTSLKHHLQLHTGERPYSCGVCNKTFIQKTHLKYHSRVHSGERPFKCDICTKTFMHKTHLKEHSRLHTGELPYACGVCSKTFNQRSHLKRHLMLHTGMRPYMCDICNKSFAQTETLKKHSRMHTGKCP